MDEEIIKNSPKKEEESVKKEETTSNSINDCSMKDAGNMDEGEEEDEDEKYEDVEDEDAKEEDAKEDDDTEEDDDKEEDSEDDDEDDDTEEDNDDINEDDDTEDDDDEDEEDAEDDDAEDDEDAATASSDEEKEVYSAFPGKRAQERTDDVRNKLIMTAQMARLNDFVDTRLTECGWKADIKNILRAEIRKNKNLTLENLYDSVKLKGKELVPASLADEILDKIQELYESELPGYSTSVLYSDEEDSDLSLTS